MKRWTKCMLMTMTAFICTGCWDSVEIDRLAIVMMTGTDLGQNGKVIGSIQIARPSELGTSGGGAPSTSTGSTQAFILEAATAEDPVSTLDRMRTKLSRQLFMGHRRVVLVGENYARRGVGPLLDEIVRNPRSRLRTYFLVAYHAQALDIMKLPYSLNRLPSDAIVDLVKDRSSVEVNAKTFLQGLGGYGDPVAMGIGEVQTLHGISQTSPKTFELSHIAVFQKDKLVGWLSGSEVQGFLWINGHRKRQSTTVRVNAKAGQVGAELLTTHTTRTVTLTKGKPCISIHVSAKYALNENASNLNLEEVQNSEQVRNALEKEITREMRSTMQALQHYQSDSFDFADSIHQKYPRLWHSVENSWRTEYSKLPVQYEVHIQVRNSGLIGKSVYTPASPNGKAKVPS